MGFALFGCTQAPPTPPQKQAAQEQAATPRSKENIHIKETEWAP